MIEFFTDPWTMPLAQWTLKTLFSGIGQLIFLPAITVAMVRQAFFDIGRT